MPAARQTNKVRQRNPGPDSTKADPRKKLGSLEIHKGSTKEGIPVVMWDSIPQCIPERCKMEEVCPYTHTGKCSVRMKYITHVYQSLIGQVNPTDAIALFKIGFHLVPLYGHLVQFKMEEFGEQVMLASDNGKRYVNPIFKEIRETIKCINSIQKDLGHSIEKDILRDSMTQGDNDYYDNLFEDGSEMDTKKRNKV